jgi:hypothetical protein
MRRGRVWNVNDLSVVGPAGGRMGRGGGKGVRESSWRREEAWLHIGGV